MSDMPDDDPTSHDADEHTPDAPEYDSVEEYCPSPRPGSDSDTVDMGRMLRAVTRVDILRGEVRQGTIGMSHTVDNGEGTVTVSGNTDDTDVISIWGDCGTDEARDMSGDTPAHDPAHPQGWFDITLSNEQAAVLYHRVGDILRARGCDALLSTPPAETDVEDDSTTEGGDGE